MALSRLPIREWAPLLLGYSFGAFVLVFQFGGVSETLHVLEERTAALSDVSRSMARAWMPHLVVDSLDSDKTPLTWQSPEAFQAPMVHYDSELVLAVLDYGWVRLHRVVWDSRRGEMVGELDHVDLD